jgi:4-amino-4-deoxy-L-arabinose transferase-like glycosyltransferase
VRGLDRSRQWRAPGRYVAAFGLILALALYRLWVMGFTGLELDIEEAYYLHWSSAPALGYFSKPPMIAWLLAAATELFGRSELAIKSVSLMLHTATAVLVYSIGRRIYGVEIGLMAGVVFATLPVVGALSLYSTTDAPLHFFWALTLRLFLKARDSGRPAWWLATGVAGGLGLLSKYTMGLLAVGLGLALAFSRSDRRWLRSPVLWLGVLAAAAVWAPNLWWNAAHDFISFRHTAHIAQLHRELLHPDHLGEFLAAQLVVFGPGLFLAFALAVTRRAVWGDARHRLLLLVSMPILALISLQALLAEANMNWASPAYVGLSIFVTAWLWERSRTWLYASVALNLLLLSVAYHYHDLADLAGVEMTAARTPYKRRLGWRELGAEVRPWTRQYPDARLVSDSRELLSFLSYYGVDAPRGLASWNPAGNVRNQFDLEGDVTAYPGARFLFLSAEPLDAAVLSRFEQVQSLGEKRVGVFPDLTRSVHGYLMSGFRGY